MEFLLKMKEEIKTEELIYEDGVDLMATEDGMHMEKEDLPEDIPETKYQVPQVEHDSMKILPHLGEVIWLKSELTDVTLDKEPELDDPMSFGYFEEHGQDRRESCFLSEGNKPGDSKFTCFYCGNESNCLKKLRAHIKTTHTGPKRISDQSKIYEAIIIYSCRYCDYRTNDNSLYSNHLRKHLAEIPVTKKLIYSKDLKACNHQFKIKHRFRCPYCSFKTSDNERIRQHMCSCHENQRPYHYLREKTRPHDGRQFVFHPCPECRYCAGRSGTLRRHIMAKHTNERPYHCTECNYQATQNETLRRHVLARHTKEKPHHCPRCAYSAVQLGTLKYHVKNNSNDESKKQLPGNHGDNNDNNENINETKSIKETAVDNSMIQYYHPWRIISIIFNELHGVISRRRWFGGGSQTMSVQHSSLEWNQESHEDIENIINFKNFPLPKLHFM